jgi:hypothetical protein
LFVERKERKEEMKRKWTKKIRINRFSLREIKKQ